MKGCSNPPTPAMPLEMECPTCGNGPDFAACPTCSGKGVFVIDKCPNQYVTDNIWDGVSLVVPFDNHLPPVAGGVLDQTEAFRQFHRAYHRARDAAMKEVEAGQHG